MSSISSSFMPRVVTVWSRLGGDLFEGKMWNVRAFARVLDRDGANVTVLIKIEECVLVQIACLGDFGGAELDVKSIGVLKVANFHG